MQGLVLEQAIQILGERDTVIPEVGRGVLGVRTEICAGGTV